MHGDACKKLNSVRFSRGNASRTTSVPYHSPGAPFRISAVLLFINAVLKSIQNFNALIYTDNVKVFCVISSLMDTILLQADLDNLATWCNVNKLSLHIAKGRPVRFRWKKLNIECPVDN